MFFVSAVCFLVKILNHISITYCYVLRNIWWASAYGKCSKPCNTGKRTRVIECHNGKNEVVEDSLCIAEDKPKSSMTCNVEECVETPLGLLKPLVSTEVLAGEDVELKWVGGKLNSSVTFDLAPVDSFDASPSFESKLEAGLPISYPLGFV